MGNASARDWYPIIGKRFNPLETVNTHTHNSATPENTGELIKFSHANNNNNKELTRTTRNPSRRREKAI